MSKQKILNITYIALMTSVICVCSWISIPATVPFTMQTFAIFAAICLIGAKKAAISVLIYILLGCCGLPVFAGFSSGFGRILGPSGGYIVGFLIICAAYGIMTKFFGTGKIIRFISLAAGLLLCYAAGTLWYVAVSFHIISPEYFLKSLKICVIPFILPDLVKAALAMSLSEIIKKHAV